MSRPVLIPVLMLMALGLLAGAGCTTLSKDECLTADWRRIGYEDGRRGHAASRLGAHRQACNQHQVKPDVAAYRRGHEQGLRKFCRPQNGYRLGLRAGHYRGVCPAPLAEAFVSAYEYGKSIYFLKRDLHNVTERLENAEAQLDQVEKQLGRKEGRLIAPEEMPAQRRALLDEIQDLKFKKQQLSERLRGLEDHSRQLAGSIQQLKQQSPYR